MGSYREACPASEDVCFFTLQWGTSDTIKRGQSTMVSWIWVTPGQAAWNSTVWNVKDFRTDFWSLKQAQHTQNFWMAESCSWEHKVNLLGIKTCSATVETRAPRQTYPNAVIVFTFWGNVFLLSIFTNAPSSASLSQAEASEQSPLLQAYQELKKLRCGTKDLISRILWTWKNETIHKIGRYALHGISGRPIICLMRRSCL